MKKVPWYISLGIAATIFGETCSAYDIARNKEIKSVVNTIKINKKSKSNEKLFYGQLSYFKKNGWFEFFQKKFLQFNLFTENFDPQAKKNTTNLEFNEDTKSKIPSFEHSENPLNFNQGKKLKDIVSDEKPFILQQVFQYQEKSEGLRTRMNPKIEDTRRKIIQYKNSIRSSNKDILLIKYKFKLNKIKELVLERKNQFSKSKPIFKDFLNLAENHQFDLGKADLLIYKKKGQANYFEEFAQQYDEIVSNIQSIVAERMKQTEFFKKKKNIELKLKKAKSIIGDFKVKNNSGKLTIKSDVIDLFVDATGIKKHLNRKKNEMRDQIYTLSGYDDFLGFYQTTKKQPGLNNLENLLVWEFKIHYSKLNEVMSVLGQSDFNPSIKMGNENIPLLTIDEVFKANGIQEICVTSSDSEKIKQGQIGTQIKTLNAMLNKEVISDENILNIINAAIYALSPKLNNWNNRNYRAWQTSGQLSSHKININNAEYITNSFWASMFFPRIKGLNIMGYVGKTDFYISACPMLGINAKARGEIISGGFILSRKYGAVSSNLNLGLSSIKQGNLELLLGISKKYSIADEDIKGYIFPHATAGVSFDSGYGILSANIYPQAKLKEKISPTLQAVYSFLIYPLSLSYNPITKSYSGTINMSFSSN